MSSGIKTTLSGAKAGQVWNMFGQISRIPRCSKNEQQIINWLREFARVRNLAFRSDQAGNTVIELPAANGYEDSPAIVLQSHVDMVCEKGTDSTHDFTKDPIELVEKDGWVCAQGTTLGADNGVGMALALAMVFETNLKHPKLELLFTVDEETGLTGANALKPGFITGKYLINLDGEDESFIVGCAGGKQTKISMPLKWVPVSESSACYELKVSGLRGGHSGIDIDKQRANAIVLLAEAIHLLQKYFAMQICCITGGRAANAIPRDAQATVWFETSSIDVVKKTLSDIESSFEKEFSTTDTELKLELIGRPVDCCEKVFTDETADKAVALLTDLPNGVYRVSQQFDGVVETSSNLARVETHSAQSYLEIITSQRSFELSSLDELAGKIKDMANLAGAEIKISGGYPTWRPNIDSSLLDKAKKVYKKLHSEDAEVKVIHAGLECAVIGKRFAGLEMVSVGPTIRDAHSPQERVNIASVDRAWQFLLELIPLLK